MLWGWSSAYISSLMMRFVYLSVMELDALSYFYAVFRHDKEGYSFVLVCPIQS
jgi:hypothetical protein